MNRVFPSGAATQTIYGIYIELNNIVTELYQIYKYIVRHGGNPPKYVYSDALEFVNMFEKLATDAKRELMYAKEPVTGNMRIRINNLDDIATRLVGDIYRFGARLQGA
jgi:hypothetical protein